RKPLRHERLARLHHHFKPDEEAPPIEALVAAGTVAPKQILIEHAGELLGCGEGDDLAGVLEADGVDEPREGWRGQRLHADREVGALEKPGEELGRRGAAAEQGKVAGHRAVSPFAAVSKSRLSPPWWCAVRCETASRMCASVPNRANASAIEA